MRNKRVLFCLRRDYLRHPGGDTMQMESYARILRQSGNHVRLHSGSVAPSDLEGNDIVFVWHLERPHDSFQPWHTAIRNGLPVVLLPTCFHANTAGFWRALPEQFKIWYRCLREPSDSASHYMQFRSWRHCRERMLTQSSCLIVNSEAEKTLLLREGANTSRVVVIPNVVDQETLTIQEPAPWNKRQRIICIGHFCPRKNQLGLIRALRGLDLQITFVGTARPMHQRYLERCRRESAGQHLFTGALSHYDTLKLLAQSRLAISTSFEETPGIANLEAAALGCNLLLPEIVPIREYFGARSMYLDPSRIDAARIREAVHLPPSPELRTHILSHYTEKNLHRFFQTLEIEEMAH